MDKETKQRIALLRHQIISPVLAEAGRNQMEYFRKIETKEFDVPEYGLKRFKASTMKGWLNKYRRYGFNTLIPKSRTDKGHYRKLTESMKVKIKDLRENFLELCVSGFYEKCLEKQILGMPPICLATLRRFLRKENLFPKKIIKGRKRFEMSRFAEMWTGDFMHGLSVKFGKATRKSILMALIDDHSRIIVAASFGVRENTLLLEDVFKEGIMKYGLPIKLYVDNGPSFVSNYLREVCAKLGIALIHSKPYDSPSRGKIERFFRTVRSSFLPEIKSGELTLDDINSKFSAWLNNYHNKHHNGINEKPIERYRQSIMKYPTRRIDNDKIDEFFMVLAKRKVIKDSTLTYKGMIYETPAKFIGSQVEIRHFQDNVKELYIYEEDIRVCKILPVDVKENSNLPNRNEISFQDFDKEI